MRSNTKKFDFEASLKRIDDILNATPSYEESDNIPKESDLTYQSGKYVKCTAFFIDLRGSTDLIQTQGRKSKTLAKIYRAYISEIVAIVNSFKTCREINIVGDCVSAIFSGKEEDSESHTIEALQAASMSNGMMSVLNLKYKKKYGESFKEIQAGIGLSRGRALVIKAGFSGSGINDLIYMGDVVNRAAKMCGLANKQYSSPICVTKYVYASAGTYIANTEENKTFQDFLNKTNDSKHGEIYVGNFYRAIMNDWVEENK